MEDDFIPDIVVVDYADILKPSSYASKEKRLEVIDDIWKNLARLAGEKHCIVITGSQGNRGSLNKDQMEEGDVAEWIGKLAHVDVFVTLNQNSTEKKMGMVRMSVLEHRHKDFNPDQNVIVLQKLDAGQPLLDSEYEK
ncbi:MAG: hypothetical protein ABIE94_05090, partial [archaeon]